MVALWQGLVASLQGNMEQSGRGARLTSVTHTLPSLYPPGGDDDERERVEFERVKKRKSDREIEQQGGRDSHL